MKNERNLRETHRAVEETMKAVEKLLDESSDERALLSSVSTMIEGALASSLGVFMALPMNMTGLAGGGVGEGKHILFYAKLTHGAQDIMEGLVQTIRPYLVEHPLGPSAEHSVRRCTGTDTVVMA